MIQIARDKAVARAAIVGVKEPFVRGDGAHSQIFLPLNASDSRASWTTGLPSSLRQA
jgi:hypothetical protein